MVELVTDKTANPVGAADGPAVFTIKWTCTDMEVAHKSIGNMNTIVCPGWVGSSLSIPVLNLGFANCKISCLHGIKNTVTWLSMLNQVLTKALWMYSDIFCFSTLPCFGDSDSKYCRLLNASNWSSQVPFYLPTQLVPTIIASLLTFWQCCGYHHEHISDERIILSGESDVTPAPRR